MEEIRIGKDVAVVWTLKKKPGFVSLFERNLTLEMSYGTKKKFMPFRVIEENKIAVTYYGKDHEQTGIHTLTLWENYGMIGEGAVDALSVFKLVSWSTMEKHDSAGDLDVATVEIETEDIEAGIRGLSAYEIAKLHGFVGTEEEWLESLGAPAREAAGKLDEKFKTETDKLSKDYNDKIDALKKVYDSKIKALADDYASKKKALGDDYDSVKSDLEEDYQKVKSALALDYAETLKGIVDLYAKRHADLVADYAQMQQQLETTVTTKMNEAVTTANEAAQELIDAKNRGEFKGEKGERGEQGAQGIQGEKGEGLSEEEHAQLVKEIEDLNGVAEQVSNDASEAKESAASAEEAATSTANDVAQLKSAIQALPDGQAVSAMVAEHTVALNDLGLKIGEVDSQINGSTEEKRLKLAETVVTSKSSSFDIFTDISITLDKNKKYRLYIKSNSTLEQAETSYVRATSVSNTELLKSNAFGNVNLSDGYLTEIITPNQLATDLTITKIKVIGTFAKYGISVSAILYEVSNDVQKGLKKELEDFMASTDESISNVETKLEGVEASTKKIDGVKYVNSINNINLSSATTIISLTNPFPVSNGGKVTLNFSDVAISAERGITMYLRSGNSVISEAKTILFENGKEISVDFSVTANATCDKISFRCVVDETSPFSAKIEYIVAESLIEDVDNIKTKVEEIQNNSIEIKKNIEGERYEAILERASIASSNVKIPFSVPFEVSQGESVRIKISNISFDGYYGFLIYLWDKRNTISGVVSANLQNKEEVDLEFTITANSTCEYISFRTAGTGNTSIINADITYTKVYGQKQHIEDLEKRINGMVDDVTKSLRKPILCFVDDDGSIGSFNSWEEIYNQLGIKCTFAVITAFIGYSENWCNWDVIDRFRNLGFDFISHTHRHIPLATSSAEEIENDFKETIKTFADHGMVAKHVVFPGNNYNDLSIGLVHKYFQSGLTYSQRPNVPPIDALRMRRYSFLKDTPVTEQKTLNGETFELTYYPPHTTEELRNIVDSTATQRGLSIIMCHFRPTHDMYWFDQSYIDKIKDMVEYAISKGCEVMTYSEAFEKYKNKVEIGSINDESYYIVDCDGVVRQK